MERKLVSIDGDAAAGFAHTLDGWLERARGPCPGTRNRKEDIVVRPLIDTWSPTLGGPLSWRVINNDFLQQDEA